MKFKTIAEAFNHYRNSKLSDIETRTKEIGTEIDTNPNADIESLNIEIDGLKEVKANIEERAKGQGNFNPITGMNFDNRVSESVDIFSSDEYRSAFFKSLLGQKLTDIETRTYRKAIEVAETEKRTDSFSTISNSAAVLPTQTLNEILVKARKIGGTISACRGFNIPSNLSIPIATPQGKASWHVEGKQVETEKPNIVNVQFSGYEIIKIFSISAIAKKMTISAFESYMIDELSKCVMECIEDSLINGSGESQGTGLLTGITWNPSNSVELEKVTYIDFVKVVGMLKRGYSANAKFSMSNATLYNHVYSICDTTNRPIFISDPKNECIGYILGKQVIIDDNIPDGTILLGDFNYMSYNIPEGIVIEVSTQSSFKSGLIDYRALAIADTKPIIDEAFIKIEIV